MAEKLDDFVFTTTGKGHSRYAQYMDGSVWKLKPGVDIPNLTTGRGSLYEMARRRGLKMRTMVQDDCLIVQAYAPEDKPLRRVA